MNKKKLNILMPLAALLLLLLSSCSFIFDDYPEDEDHMKAIIMLSLSRDGAETRAAFPATGEEAITSARIIVFSGSAVEHNQVYSASNPPFDNPIRITVATGTKTIYVVANETATLATNLANVSSESGLQALMADEISAGLAAPFVMIGKETVTLTDPGLSDLTVKVKRVAAKINLQFKKDTDAEVKITKVSLLKNTTKSTLWEGSSVTYTQGYWSHSQSTEMTLDESLNDYLTVYVYENLGNDENNKTNATQLEVEALYNNIPTKYRVYINEKISLQTPDNPGDPSSSDIDLEQGITDHQYNIKRNYSYNLNGTIVSMGEFDGLVLETNVLPWYYLPSEVLYDYNFEISPQPTLSSHEYTVEGTSSSVQFTFKLNNPINTVWVAQLSNPIDFEFVGASNGMTGDEVTITIKPKNASDETERTTEFYITALSAELPIIDGTSNVGSGNRVVIKQPAIP